MSADGAACMRCLGPETAASHLTQCSGVGTLLGRKLIGEKPHDKVEKCEFLL